MEPNTEKNQQAEAQETAQDTRTTEIVRLKKRKRFTAMRKQIASSPC